MGPTGEIRRVVQIHPTRRCNLRCLHCYSSSGPNRRDQLDVELLRAALRDAGGEGYTVASFSGGEPLLYAPLRDLLAAAKRCGMRTAVTSNGMLLDERRLAMLRGVTDLLAISVDGVPSTHNRLRGSVHAFSTMQGRLAGVRAAAIPFGFIFTLTLHNLHELESVVEFALAEGARLVQVHPLEEVGRARQHMAGTRPDAVEASFAGIEAARLQAMVGDRLRIHLDLAHRQVLRSHPERAYAAPADAIAAPSRLADLVSPLVIEADGTVVPLQYGLARSLTLGNLKDAPLAELAARWRNQGYSRFLEVCRRAFAEVTNADGLPLVNWYEVVGRVAGEAEGRTAIAS